MTLEQIFLRLTDAADKGTQLLTKAKAESDEKTEEAPKVKIEIEEDGEAAVIENKEEEEN